MNTARFHVFSGTGNGLHLAKTVASRLENRGWGTEVVEIRSRSEAGRPLAAANPETLDVFVFPVYALSLPHIVDRYIRGLGPRQPLADGSRPRAAILATNGRISARFRDGHEGRSLAQADRLLGRLGWDVLYRETLDYPQNITNFITAQDEERKRALLGLVLPRIEAVADDLASGKFHKRRCNPVPAILAWPFGWLFRLVGRRCIAFLFAADGHCNGCGLCAERCPAGAIALSGKHPRWNYACEGCERCINLCPRKAIQASFVRAAVMLAVFFASDAEGLRSLVRGLLPSLPSAAFGFLWFPLSVAIALAVLRLADYLLVGLAFVPGLRPFLAFGWTRWFRRYKAPVGS